MGFSFELINGLAIGLEHIDASEITDDAEYMIVLSFLVFRFGLIKFKEE